jgi:NMD protein affecting ribosome stability and mRNA decay
MHFCCVCCREFGPDGQQRENWAWKLIKGEWRAAAKAAGGEGVNEVSDRVICSACGCSIPRSAAKPSGDGWIAIDLAVCCGCRLVAQGAEWEALALKREEEIERLRTVLRDIARGDPFHENSDGNGFAVTDYAAYRIAAKRAIEAAEAAGGQECE